LERLAEYGGTLSRRGAVLALGFLGLYESNSVLGRTLRDGDQTVSMLAENAIREVWCRDGSETQRQGLGIVIRLNNSFRFGEAVELATELIAEAPRFAELWNQRAIAHYRLEDYEEAANDCQQTLELNPFHFNAAVGMAHCYLELGEGYAALECFRRAVDLNPRLDAVREQIEFLQRALEEI
jgi:tetratricopeptide (TPR) repeat protein